MKKRISTMRLIAGYLPLLTMMLCSSPAFAAEDDVSPETMDALRSKYYYVGYFYEGVAVVWNGDYQEHKAGLVDTTGKEIVPLKYDDIEISGEGTAKVILNDKCGFINTSGRVIVPCIYDGASHFNEGYAAVYKNVGVMDEYGTPDYRYGFINKNGKLITPIVYKEEFWAGGSWGPDGNSVPGRFSNGYARVIRDGKYGIINTNGKEVVPCRYTDMWRCEDYESLSLIPVMIDNKLGYVDLSGKEVIKCNLDLDRGEPFEGEFAKVARNGSRGAINKKGEVIVPAMYYWVVIRNNGDIEVANKGLFIDDWGLYNGNGEMIRPLKSMSKWAGLLHCIMIIMCLLIPVSAVVTQLKCSQRRFSFGRILFSICSVAIAGLFIYVICAFSIITDAVVIIPVIAATIVFVWFLQQKNVIANILRILVNILFVIAIVLLLMLICTLL